MDAVKLLGDLLGNQSMARGVTAQDVLKAILTGGGTAPPSAPPSGPRAASTSPPPVPHASPHQPLSRETGPMTHWDTPARSPAEIMRHGAGGGQATLGGLIRDAVEGYRQRQSATRTSEVATRGTRDPQANSQAQILIRAMVNAAKSDGRVDEQEQQRIIDKLGQLSQDEIDFLRYEFAQPLDVQRFAQQVPRGLEVPVYTLSLTAIDLDTNREAQYLHQLAQTLGIPPETCNQIHVQLGAPQLYR